LRLLIVSWETCKLSWPSYDLETDLETIFIVQRSGQGRGWSRVGGGGKLSISATHPDLITVPQSRLQSVPKIVRPIFYVIVTSTSYSASIDCKILSAVLSIHAHHTKIFYYFIRARCSFNCVIVYFLSWKKNMELKTNSDIQDISNSTYMTSRNW